MRIARPGRKWHRLALEGERHAAAVGDRANHGELEPASLSGLKARLFPLRRDREEGLVIITACRLLEGMFSRMGSLREGHILQAKRDACAAGP